MKERLEQLKKAREIYEETIRTGIYHPKKMKEGYKLCYPDQPLPNGFAQRRFFIGYMQHLYDKVFAELEDLFMDSTITGEEEVEPSKEEQTHSEDDTKVMVDLDDKKDKPAPKKRGRKPKK